MDTFSENHNLAKLILEEMENQKNPILFKITKSEMKNLLTKETPESEGSTSHISKHLRKK